MTIFRPAREMDLSQINRIYYENEVRGTPDPPPFADNTVPEFRHILQTGTMYVAEQDNSVCAYGAAITRSHITYLTDLFVHPDYQSAQLGKTLLHYVLPPLDAAHTRCTMSSTDPRAQALYIRSGMQPQWPNFNLLWQGPAQSIQPATDLEIVEGESNDPELLRWDTLISGRARPAEHAFWVAQQRALPLWFRRGGETIGYGYARMSVSSIWHPEFCLLGPIGGKTPEDAKDCVLAAVAWGQQRTNRIRLDIPGPHASLAPLLSAQFRIVYVETFLTSAPFFDARCYISSGSNLL